MELVPEVPSEDVAGEETVDDSLEVADETQPAEEPAEDADVASASEEEDAPSN